MGCTSYAALGLRGLEALASLGQVGRCIFDSVEAKELTKDAGMDLGADTSSAGHGPGVPVEFVTVGVEPAQEFGLIEA